MPETLAPDVTNYLAKEKSIREKKGPIPEKLTLPTIDKIPQELVNIAENIGNISGAWNPVEIYTADSASIDTEMKKVFHSYDKGEEYNPQLTYSYANSLDLSKSREQLLEQMKKLRSFGKADKKRGGKQTLDRTARLFRSALYFKIKDDLATYDLVDGIKAKDEDKIATALHQKYPGLDASLEELATEELKKIAIGGDPDDEEEIGGKGILTAEEYKWLKDKNVTDEEQESAFKYVLSQYGMLKTPQNPNGYSVVVTKDVTGIDVRDKSANGPTVFLAKDRPKPMTASKLLVLLAHEIEGHARQSINGEKLFKIGGGKLKIDNEQLYEGLGLRYELDFRKKMFGQEEAAPRPYYVSAVKMAETGKSFFEIFKDQVDKRIHTKLKIPMDKPIPKLSEIDEQKQNEIKRGAWNITYRVMRGHTDMSNKKSFANPKDLGYLRGYQMDKQLRNNDLGFINEEGVISSGALPLLAELHLSQDQIPIKFKDVTTKYWEEVLKPQYLTSKAA